MSVGDGVTYWVMVRRLDPDATPESGDAWSLLHSVQDIATAEEAAEIENRLVDEESARYPGLVTGMTMRCDPSPSWELVV